jgi:hypothetical protein
MKKEYGARVMKRRPKNNNYWRSLKSSQQKLHQVPHHLLSLPHRSQHIETLYLLWEVAATDPPQIKVR